MLPIGVMPPRRWTVWIPAVAAAALVASGAFADPWPALPIPPENARTLRAAPPRPPAGDVADRARLLVDALRAGTPDAARQADGFFLPREPFLAIKDMSGAAGYFATLLRWFHRDLEAERARRRDWSDARFVGFDLSRACTWMTVGREANRLPYWSCYRSALRVAVGGAVQRVEVRVMIHWGTRWYATHLGAIPRPT